MSTDRHCREAQAHLAQAHSRSVAVQKDLDREERELAKLRTSGASASDITEQERVVHRLTNSRNHAGEAEDEWQAKVNEACP